MSRMHSEGDARLIDAFQRNTRPRDDKGCQRHLQWDVVQMAELEAVNLLHCERQI